MIEYKDIKTFTELVAPEYHGQTVGRTLVGMMDELHFYENCGFEKSDATSPMFITSLWT